MHGDPASDVDILKIIVFSSVTIYTCLVDHPSTWSPSRLSVLIAVGGCSYAFAHGPRVRAAAPPHLECSPRSHPWAPTQAGAVRSALAVRTAPLLKLCTRDVSGGQICVDTWNADARVHSQVLHNPSRQTTTASVHWGYTRQTRQGPRRPVQRSLCPGIRCFHRRTTRHGLREWHRKVPCTSR